MKNQWKTKAQLIKELEALRQSEERYRQLFENTNDAIMSSTLDGILTAATSPSASGQRFAFACSTDAARTARP